MHLTCFQYTAMDLTQSTVARSSCGRLKIKAKIALLSPWADTTCGVRTGGGAKKTLPLRFFVPHSVVQVSLMTPTVPSWQMIGTAFKTRGKITLYLPPEGPECKCDAPAREAATLILAEQKICKEATIAYYRTGVVVLCRKRVEESEIRTKAETRPD